MSGDLERVQAHIDEALKHFRHLQQLVARPSQAHAIPAERSVPSPVSVPATEPPLEQALVAGGEATVPSGDEAAVPSAATSDVEQAQDIPSGIAEPTSSVPLHAPLSRAEAAAEGQAGVMLSPEGQLADLQGHFNALLQVLSRRCLNNRD
jgi:hypothetical protein